MNSSKTTQVSISELQNPQVIIERFFHIEQTVRTAVEKTVMVQHQDCSVKRELAATLSLLMKVKRIFRKKMFNGDKSKRLERNQSNELTVILESLELAVGSVICTNPNLELSRQLRIDAESYLTKYEYAPIQRPFVNAFLFLYRSKSTAVKVIGGLMLSTPVVAIALSSAVALSSFQPPEPKSSANISLATSYESSLNEQQPAQVTQASNEESPSPLVLLLLGASAGAAGSIVSILLRIEDIVRDEKSYQVDPVLPIFIGLFKPVIGGTFGIFTIALLSAGVISIGVVATPGAKECLFFSIAFAVGFSERLAKDVIQRTEDMISPSTDSELQDISGKTEKTSTTAAVVTASTSTIESETIAVADSSNTSNNLEDSTQLDEAIRADTQSNSCLEAALSMTEHQPTAAKVS